MAMMPEVSSVPAVPVVHDTSSKVRTVVMNSSPHAHASAKVGAWSIAASVVAWPVADSINASSHDYKIIAIEPYLIRINGLL